MLFYHYLLAALGVGLLALDQWTKLWTAAAFAAPVAPNIYSTADPARPFLPGLVELTRVHNYGAAWSSFSGQKWLLVGLTGILLTVLLVLVIRRVVRHPLGLTACTLVLAGGLGNLIDRVRVGYVVDMFHFTFWPSYPVFNVADICVVIGAVIGSVYYLWFYEKYDARPKNPKEGAADGKTDAPTE